MKNNNLYTIHLHDLTLFTYIGMTEEERSTKQRLELHLKVMFRNILNSSNELHLNYVELTENIIEFADTHIFVSLEEFNDRISQHLFTFFLAIDSISLESYKFRLALHTPIKKVGISTYRTRIDT